MKTLTTCISSKGQVVLPKEVRKRLDLQAGDMLIVEIIDGQEVRLIRRPRDLVKWMRGLGKEVWQELGGGEAYIQRERDAWDAPN